LLGKDAEQLISPVAIHTVTGARLSPEQEGNRLKRRSPAWCA
jgi:hypothetical protein